MNEKFWIIDESILKIKQKDGNIYTPSAKEIYNLVYKNKKIQGFSHEDPADLFNELSFSRIPLGLKVKTDVITETEAPGIYLNVVVDKSRKLLNISLNKDFHPDHIIENNTWFPFVPGAIQDIKNFFKSVGVTGTGKITLKQYVDFKKNKENQYLFEDSVPKNFHRLSSIQLENNIAKNNLFIGNLYKYQQEGFNWLSMIAGEDAGCILADEMGLGKTIQIIALIAQEIEIKNSITLVIAPATLLENWRRELKKFAPDIKSLIHRGGDRTGFYKYLLDYDVIITSYETMLRDLSMFKMIDWDLVILDEAQAIKNPEAKRTDAVKQLPRRISIAVTGTPVENHITDLWSIMDFSFPGLLGDIKDFEKEYEDNPESASLLEPIVTPFLLRREVVDVAGDLPERIDIPQVIELSDYEAVEYENIRQKTIKEYGGKAGLVILTRLRMFCTHPFIISDDTRVLNPNTTNKYSRLLEVFEEIISYNEKALIFTSYTEMTSILVNDLKNRYGIYCNYIDGRVPVEDRQNIIDEFSNIEGSGVLILNPRAAGTGLNITAANHVIHYNLEWNPALEDQASARAYRRGQDRPVTVHRFYYSNTVEEIINERIEAKREMAGAVIVGTDGKSDDYKDILNALSISPIIDTEG